MALQETDALILRTYNLAEADKIVVCLTRSAGLIRGVAKGSRKLKNRFGASLEPFTHVHLTYYEKENQELVSINQTEILRSYFNLLGNPSFFTGMAYMGDLLMEFSPPHQTNDKLFRMAVACFEASAQNPDDLQAILRYFEIWLLKLEGFLADLRQCAECHRDFEPDEPVYVTPSEFALRCRNCRGSGAHLISRELHAQLRIVQRLPPTKFGEHVRVATVETRREMAELTHQLIGRVLERLPRVKPTFAQNFSSRP